MYKKINIIYVKTDSLTEYSRNPRKNRHVIPKMIASINEFGFTIPILVKPNMEVIDGHLRLLAAREMSIKEVPIVIADGWNDAQVKAFRLLANRSVQWAEWDNDMLRLEIDELRELDFNLELTGFSDYEIDDLTKDSEIPDFKEFDESVADDLNDKSDNVQCPNCGHSFKK